MATLILLQDPLVAMSGDLHSPGSKSPRIQAWKARLEEEKIYAARRASQDAEEASRVKQIFASAKSFRHFAVEAESIRQPALPKEARQRKTKIARSSMHRKSSNSATNHKEARSALAYGETLNQTRFDTIFAPLRDSSRDGS
jgi:hypothetical protein